MMTIGCRKCSMNENCICIPSSDECFIRKQSYMRSGKQWAMYMNTYLGHIQVACTRLIKEQLKRR